MSDQEERHALAQSDRPSLSAAAIAAEVGGHLIGDESVRIWAAAPIHRAEAHHLSFLASARYAPLVSGRLIGVLLVTPELAERGHALARVVVENPRDAMLPALLRLYQEHPSPSGVHPTAVVGQGVRLAEGVAVGPYAVIGDDVVIGARTRIEAHAVVGGGVVVGEDCHIHSAATLYAGTELGDRVRVHAGARLGADGFGYALRGGARVRIPHVGRCIVGPDVEVGANTTIDRGSIDDTVIGAGTKIDNLVHVGHNVQVGAGCLVIAQAGIAGSVHVADGCEIGGQAGIAAHLTIGAGARIIGQAGVTRSVPSGETWSGYPARLHGEALRAQATLTKLPSIVRELNSGLNEIGEQKAQGHDN